MQHRLLQTIVAASLLLICCVPLFCCASESQFFRFGVALEGLPERTTSYRTMEEELNLPISMVNLFLQWPTTPDAGAFPTKAAQAVSEHGALLVVTWEPLFLANGKEVSVPAEEIVSGRWDNYIERFARAAAAWGGPCIIRFGHEMNLVRYHWGGDVMHYGPASPARYRLMFRHVVTLIRRAGASNVRFAFCPNIDSDPDPKQIPEAAWNTAGAYYPGDAYVDVVGMDGYNWGTTQTTEHQGWTSQWRSFESLFSPLLTELRSIAPAKPLYVFETATAAQGGDKAQWIRGMADTLSKWQLAGLIWFQINKEIDWRIQEGLQGDALEPLRSITNKSRGIPTACNPSTITHHPQT